MPTLRLISLSRHKPLTEDEAARLRSLVTRAVRAASGSPFPDIEPNVSFPDDPNQVVVVVHGWGSPISGAALSPISEVIGQFSQEIPADRARRLEIHRNSKRHSVTVA